MRRRARRVSDDSEVDMTPMLDIVFIMLIFFIVTAKFITEQGIDMTQPPPNDNPPDDNAKRAIAVYVDNNDRCSVDGGPVFCDAVPLRVEKLLTDKPGASIILKINEAASHGLMVELKDTFDEGGYTSKIEIIPNGV
ncbi:MAG: biopolymer transporter ExbD [Robiginitomaculum sp.]